MTFADLAAPVDVYADWIDACDSVATDPHAAITTATVSSLPSTQRKRAGLAPDEQMTAEDEQFIVDDEGDAEAEYADED